MADYQYRIRLFSILLLLAACSISECSLKYLHAKERRSIKLSSSEQDALSKLSPSALKQLLEHITESNKDKGTCTNEMTTLESEIIRTKDSINNGATFLNASSNIGSAMQCRDWCCEYESKKGDFLQKCNVAVYQLHQVDNKARCFLFDCYSSHTRNFSCVFSTNAGFTSFKQAPSKVKEADNQVEELENVAKTTPHLTTSTMQTTTTTSAITRTTTTTATTTSSTTTTAPTTTLTTFYSTASSHANHISSKYECEKVKCKRMEWQCDNKCCIPIYNVCDQMSHCSDGSDELGCPTTNNTSEHVEVSSTQKTSLTTFSQPHVANIRKKVVVTPSSAMTTTAVKTTRVIKDIKLNPEFLDPQKPSNDDEENKKKMPKVSATTHHVDVEHASVDAEAGAVLPLAIGLAVTACVLVLVACRVRTMKRKLRRRGKALTMDESDYLINGMYL